MKNAIVDDGSVDKALGMARVSARGGFNLFWGLAVSTVISAVGVIIVARLLSPSEYGLVTVALTAPSLIQIFRDWGMDTATTRYTARYNSEGKVTNVRGVLIAGLLFETVLGLILSILTFVLSGFLAADVFERPEIAPLIQTASFGILAGALFTAAQSAFTGVERMSLNSVTMILQSCLTTALMTLLVVFGLGSYGAVIGSTIAALLSGLISILILLTLYRSLRKQNGDRPRIGENIRTMFKYGLPLSLSAIISGFLAQFYNFLIAIYATNLMIGNYTVAANFTVLITFFSTPISTMLFPAFSKLDSQTDRETVRHVFKFSVKFGALLVVPAATAIITLSQPAVSTIFGEEYSNAPLFLALLTVGALFSALGNLSLGSLINSQGKTKVNLALTILTSCIGLPMSLILIPRYGIIGLIVTSLTAGIPSLIIGLNWARTKLGAVVDWVSSAKILLSSATAGVITYIILSQLNVSNWIRLIIGAAIFLCAYVAATTLARTLNQFDRSNLRAISKDLGPLEHLIGLLLNIVEKLTTVLER